MPTLRQTPLLSVAAALGFAGVTIAQGPPPAPVFVRPAQREVLTELRPVVGNLRAVRRAEVASIEEGRVLEVLVEVGTEVTKGQVLARLDARRLQSALDEATASAEAWQETVRDRQAGLERARADFESIKATVEKSPGAVSEQGIRSARTEVEQAEAQLEIAKREQTQSQIRRDLLDTRVKDMEIRALFPGNVVQRNVDPGEWLPTGGAVATVVSNGLHEAWIEVDERFDFSALVELDSIRVRVDSTGEELDSKRVRLVGDVDPRSRRAILVADLVSVDGILAPGMSVTAQVPTGREVERLLLPSDALVRDSGGGFVYVVRPGQGGAQVAMPVNVQMLYGLDAETIVCEASIPIEAGEPIIVEGNERLRPFSPVAPEKKSSTRPSDKSPQERSR